MLDQKTPLSFTDFRTIEFTLVADLNRMGDIARKLRLPELMSQIEQVRQTLERRSFSIAVVGEFKRGKSTFINALLGKEILPSDIAPTSATLNRVTYGLRPTVTIVFKSEGSQAGRTEEIGIDQLSAYVTKLTPEAAAIAAQVQEAIVYYPIPYCQNNVNIIDTPGLNDDAAMTAVTVGVLARVDAAIMVIMPEAPFAGSEGDFLNNLLANDIGKVMFVVTAIDRVRNAHDRERVLKRISQRIKERLERRAAEQYGEASEEYQRVIKRIGTPKVFAVSGYDALQAKVMNDVELFEASGFRTFETALETFLTEERGAVALKVVADRINTYGDNLAKTIIARRTELVRRRYALNTGSKLLADRWAPITELLERELQAVDDARTRTQDRIAQLIDLLSEEMGKVSAARVQDAILTAEELNRASVGALGGAIQRGGQRLLDRVSKHLSDDIKESSQSIWKKTAEKLPEGPQRSAILASMADQVADAMSTTAAGWFENMAVVLRYELRKELERLGPSVETISAFVAQIEQYFVADFQLSAPVSQFATIARQAITSATTAQAKVTEYYTKTLQSLGPELISLIDPAAIALNQCNRALLALGQARNILNSSERVALFKTSYGTALKDEIAQALEQYHVAQQIDERVVKAFEQIKHNIQGIMKDVDICAQPLHQLLQDVQARRLVMIEHKISALDEMASEMQHMLQRMHRISDDMETIMAT